jgi:tRNA(Ile)-lysidine synthase
MAAEFSHDFVERSPDRAAFNRELMSTLERAMARRTIRSALIDVFPDASRLETAHVEALVDGLADDRFARDLPYGLRAETEYDRLIVSRSGDEQRAAVPCLLAIPGTTELGSAGRVVAEVVEPSEIAGTADSVTIAADAIGTLVADSVRAGDRMRPLGMTGSRKLSDLLIDAKVPRRRRLRTPVVRDSQRIVWLAGVRMSEEYRVTVETTRAVRLTWERE